MPTTNLLEKILKNIEFLFKSIIKIEVPSITGMEWIPGNDEEESYTTTGTQIINNPNKMQRSLIGFLNTKFGLLSIIIAMRLPAKSSQPLEKIE